VPPNSGNSKNRIAKKDCCKSLGKNRNINSSKNIIESNKTPKISDLISFELQS
jgi:hypothetical protein